MNIEANSIWKRKSDGRRFVVGGLASTRAGQYVTVESYETDAESKFNPISGGQIPKDQFLKDYEFSETESSE